MEFIPIYDWTFFDVMREFVFWSSPLVFLAGVVLLMYSNYRNFEMLIGKEYGLRKKLLPKMEMNIYSFHDWCMKKHTFIGLICVIYAVVVFLLFKRFASLSEVLGEPY